MQHVLPENAANPGVSVIPVPEPDPVVPAWVSKYAYLIGLPTTEMRQQVPETDVTILFRKII